MKADRHRKILELIREYEIGTQEELCEKLNRSGFSVTQATVSRDIRELKLSKRADGSGRQRYLSLHSMAGTDAAEEKFNRIFRDSVSSVDMAQNILVIRTASGMAMAAAAAFDAMQFSEVVGCIAGDDTIFAAIRSVQETGVLLEKLKGLIRQG